MPASSSSSRKSKLLFTVFFARATLRKGEADSHVKSDSICERVAITQTGRLEGCLLPAYESGNHHRRAFLSSNRPLSFQKNSGTLSQPGRAAGQSEFARQDEGCRDEAALHDMLSTSVRTPPGLERRVLPPFPGQNCPSCATHTAE